MEHQLITNYIFDQTFVKFNIIFIMLILNIMLMKNMCLLQDINWFMNVLISQYVSHEVCVSFCFKWCFLVTT